MNFEERKVNEDSGLRGSFVGLVLKKEEVKTGGKVP